MEMSRFSFSFFVRLRIFLIAFVLSTFTFHSASANTEQTLRSVDPVVTKISARLKKAIENSGFKSSDLGIWVGTRKGQDVESIFMLNPEKQYIPASLSKVVTAGAVLSQLHPGFKYKTFLVADAKAKIENETLKGHLYLKGGGDPSFVSENMWFMVNELTRSGITRIEGDVVVDDSLFDKVRFGDDRQEERVDRAYDAPVGAMSMNWNSINVYVRPGDKVGDQLKVRADVMSPHIKVRNETRTVAAGKGKTVTVERRTEKGFDGEVLIVSGAMSLGLPEVVVFKNITQPDMWSGYNLVEFLKQRGVTVAGTVRADVSPENHVILAISESKPLSLIVADMGKWSNNYVAEMLVKNLAAQAGEKPATMQAGMKHVIAYLEKAGFAKNEMSFINAAGFTRRNKMTPQQIGKFLEFVHADFSIFPEFLSALPIAGVDGTLRSRMKNSAAEKWVRAKTGLLNGAVGLAGYAGRSGGSVISFAFIYNGAGREDQARALFDRMAGLMVEE